MNAGLGDVWESVTPPSLLGPCSVPTLGGEAQRHPAGQREPPALGVQGHGQATAHLPLAAERSAPGTAGTSPLGRLGAFSDFAS